MKKLLLVGLLIFASTAVFPFANWMSNSSVNSPEVPAINVSQNRMATMEAGRVRADITRLKHERRVQNVLPGMSFAVLAGYLGAGAVHAAFRVPQVDAALALAAGAYSLPYLYHGHVQGQQIRSLQDSLVEPVAQ